MADFVAVHAALRTIMLAEADGLVVARDEPGVLELRTSAADPRTGQPGWFGTVTTKASYVAYHLIPLYTRLDLAADLSPGLARRRQGKTCFNFKAVDPPLFAELAELTHRVRAATP